MDVVRTARKTAIARPLGIVLPLVALGAAAVWALPLLARGTTAGPAVARSSIVLDVARRGTLLRSVSAAGVLVPDRVHVVATNAEGIVESLRVRAGGHVHAGETIAVLSNPELTAAVADARAQLAAAQAELRSARAAANASRLDRDGIYRSAAASAERAVDAYRTYAALNRRGLIGDLPYHEAASKAGEDRGLAQIAARQIGVDAAN